MGECHQVGEQGACLARTAVLASQLDESIPGLSINRFCASGLESVNLAANQIAGGSGDSYIAGGVESMSRTPMMSDGGAVGVDPSFKFDNYFVPQGIGADIIATLSKPGISSPCSLNAGFSAPNVCISVAGLMYSSLSKIIKPLISRTGTIEFEK